MGGYEGNAIGRCWHAVMKVHDMTWVHMLLGGAKRVHDVRGVGVPTWAGSGSRKTGNTAIWKRQDTMGVHGDIMEHGEEVQLDGGALRAVIWRCTYLPASCFYRHTSGAFLSVLMRGWSYVNVKVLIWNRYEVLECLPWMEGVNCSGWSRWFGGSNRRNQQVVQVSKYSRRQSNFKQKSVIRVCMMIIRSITWRSSMWSDIWGWVSITWEDIWISYLQQFFISHVISGELKSLLLLEFSRILFVAQNCIFLEFLRCGVSRVHLTWSKLIYFTC